MGSRNSNSTLTPSAIKRNSNASDAHALISRSQMIFTEKSEPDVIYENVGSNFESSSSSDGGESREFNLEPKAIVYASKSKP